MTVVLPGVSLTALPDESVQFAVDSGLLEGKAVEELDDGDLLIEGTAAVYDGIDREGENFEKGAFERGIKSFLNGQAALCYHHKHDHLLGKVIELEEVEGKGLKFKARVDHQPETSPLRHLYNAVKKGSLRGVSVGGFFRRKLTEAGRKISDVDLTEISLTPVPVHNQTSFAVVAGKALEGMDVESGDPTPEAESMDQLTAAHDSLAKLVETLESKSVKSEEGKSLPKNYDPSAAGLLSEYIAGVSRLRTLSTSLQAIGDSPEALRNLADSTESACVDWEASAHKLAAKIGPLPPSGF